MFLLEWILALLLGAVLLTSLAQWIHVPSPALLALGGACLALLPHGPQLTLDPALALALFVAPVLLDAAWESSLRDLRENWIPVTSLVFIAVAVTTIAVAVVARRLLPSMTWPVAIALGALVSPPDAAAATAVLRQVSLPRRMMVILESESLLNDASALFIYRLAVGAALVHGTAPSQVASTLALVVAGSVGVGILAAFPFAKIVGQFSDPPRSIVMQFLGTFAVWILTDRLNLSGVLAIVAFTMVISRRASIRMPAAVRVPSFAVWDTVVFVLNALAFVLVGLQIRPILTRVGPEQRLRDIVFAVMVLATVILARMAWLAFYNASVRLSNRVIGRHLWWPIRVAPVKRAIVVAWCGMRGTVTLAAALALPDGSHGPAFPYRDLIVVTSFTVVLGTLVIQGFTLLPLLKLLGLDDEEQTLEREAQSGRMEMFEAALQSLAGSDSEVATVLRREYAAALAYFDGSRDDVRMTYREEVMLRAASRAAARERLMELRASGRIGEEAFHALEAELDLIELGAEVRSRW